MSIELIFVIVAVLLAVGNIAWRKTRTGSASSSTTRWPAAPRNGSES
jgi:hypothetical protein